MDSGKKMTVGATKYLTERGWIAFYSAEKLAEHPTLRQHWYRFDSLFDAGVDPPMLRTDDAVSVQQAHDADKEREAWDRFAAAILSTATNVDVSTLGVFGVAASCGQFADALLAERRSRFAVEVVKDPDKCSGCRKEIDTTVCGCGESFNHHGSVMDAGHAFIPAGCECAFGVKAKKETP